jgi:hypothetical protein
MCAGRRFGIRRSSGTARLTPARIKNPERRKWAAIRSILIKTGKALKKIISAHHNDPVYST